ncbi:MAG: NAD(P)/FAD-dependent oxidoreductase [Flavobacteriales bacterium]|nr:NAD(P)/FAD-dependent oxidoreductase [Flavobacteriales bacterium]
MEKSNGQEYNCCIIGAGPAGLGTAWELVKNGETNLIIIDRNEVVGGLARTEIRDGARFDVGPHRFFTKNEEVNALWKEVLGSDFIPVDRLTRIYYKGKFFNYPIKAQDVLLKLGPLESFQAMVSYGLARIKPKKKANTFEEWISQMFGTKLYKTFFKTYTEKVWGIPCSEIGAEWAAQRIKGLNFVQVVKNALAGSGKGKPKTLVDQFDYPVEGAGQMYEKMAERVVEKGGKILMNTTVKKFVMENGALTGVVVTDQSGQEATIKARHFFNSAPITHFFHLLNPAPPAELNDAANALYYREHITVNFLITGENLFPDQWIYVHAPEVKAARIANYNNFSDRMTSKRSETAVSVEYFVFKSDDLWKMSDEALVKLAGREMEMIGLCKEKDIINGWVVRETESYPTYYLGYEEPYNALRDYLDAIHNLSPIGRGGLYKYNNQDHSTYSGLLAARNYLKLPGSPYNLWNINIDAEYHESAERSV